MAIYICDVCGEMKDDDYDPCVEHPTDSALFCCEGCAEDPMDDGDYAYDNWKDSQLCD